MTATVHFDIPADLWLSSNRLPRNRNHLHRIALELHALAGWTARAQLGPRTITPPVEALWTVHYAKGTGKADAANAQPTTKRLLDGLVKAGLLAEDDDTHVRRESFMRGPNLTITGPARRPLRRITLTLTPAE